ncbi:MAG: asparagine synthase [Brachyspira sp.]|nr:asparagine synthase [Brachyspira sp.]
MINKNYCMSHYLAFRFIKNENINFFENLSHKVYKPKPENELLPVKNIDDIECIIKEKIKKFYVPNKTAILLSGGIDSAILASYLPKDTIAYTFKCIADGAIDETEAAKKYCDTYGLKQEIIEMHWSDFEELTPEILEYDGVPFHSIEVQLVKAAKYAKSQGINRLIIGESADLIFGGMDKLLSKDWDFNDFVERYNFINPEDILKEYINIREVYEKYRLPKDKIDFLKFMDEIFAIESSTSYMHAFNKEGIEYLDPYSFMKMTEPLDLKRIRNGEPKYLIRELFAKRYPDLKIPDKIPMPRATEQWLKAWKGPQRVEFRQGGGGFSGDQKWLLWCLEKFLDKYDKQ